MTRLDAATALCVMCVVGVTSLSSAAAAPQTRTGTVHVTATITFTNNTPPGTTLSATASIGAGDYTSATSAVSQSLTCNATIVRTGNTGKATVDCPYKFTFDSAVFSTIKLGAGFGVNSNNGSISQSVPGPVFPANGATTSFAFSLVM